MTESDWIHLNPLDFNRETPLQSYIPTVATNTYANGTIQTRIDFIHTTPCNSFYTSHIYTQLRLVLSDKS